MWRHQDLSPLFRLHLFAILVSEFSSPTISTRVVDAQLCNIIFSQHYYTIYSVSQCKLIFIKWLLCHQNHILLSNPVKCDILGLITIHFIQIFGSMWSFITVAQDLRIYQVLEKIVNVCKN